ncbi:MAG: ribosome-binding factor A [Ignavibacteria bacterium]|nr:MAG: ribosome-binding factor A [Ignavibacteria bacterium]KAF0161453.1 MAG: ribosome-binding factor A [Ignavibacteria bacterium]
MPSFRLQKVSHQIKDEISLILLQKLNDPKFRLVTVTNLKVSPDLKQAKIYLSVFEKELRGELIELVNEMKGMIRSELAHKMSLRFVPELVFFIDDTLDYVEKMEDLFKKIHENDNQNNSK